MIKMNNLHSVTIVNGGSECAVCGGAISCALCLWSVEIIIHRGGSSPAMAEML